MVDHYPDGHNVGLGMVCDTPEEREIERLTITVSGMRQVLCQIRTWVNLHKTGELSAEGMMTQILADCDRCLPKGKTEGQVK